MRRCQTDLINGVGWPTNSTMASEAFNRARRLRSLARSLLPSQGSPYNGPAIMKRASLHTLGCRLNQAETAVLEARLRRDGYRSSSSANRRTCSSSIPAP